MIEHLCWAKDSDRWLGTRNAYEVVSAFGNSQTGSAVFRVSLVSVRAGLNPGQVLKGCSFRPSPLIPETLSISPLSFLVCGSNLHMRYHHAISPLSTEAGAGILPFPSFCLARGTQNHLYRFLLPTPTLLLMVKGPSHGTIGSSFILRSQGVLYNSLLNH